MEGGDLQALSASNRENIDKKLKYVLATNTPGKPPRPEVEAASLARDLASHAVIRDRLPLLVHDGTSLTGPSTLTLSDGRSQFAVIACTHIASSCTPAAAAIKLEVAAGLAEERAEALRSKLADTQPGSNCHVAVGVATTADGLQWVLPPQQPGWGNEQLLERAVSKGPCPKQREGQNAWRLAAVLLTVAVAAALGFAMGSS